MSREAMKLALEALEFNQANWQGKDKAITAIKQARSAPVQEPVGTLNIWFYKGHGNYDFDYWGSLGEGTYTVHAAKSEAPSHNSTCNETLRAQGKAYPRTCKKCGFGPCVGKPKSDTTPPAAQRSWVGLTDEEVLSEAKRFALGLAFPFNGITTPEMFARAIEAKLKERNV